MDEVDRAITKFENTVVIYDSNQLSSVGDISRRGSATSFNFKWRSPLDLLQRKKKERPAFTVMNREAQMESVIFDFTHEDDVQCWFRNIQLTFLDDVEAFETAILENEAETTWEFSDFQDAVFDNSVGIHGSSGRPSEKVELVGKMNRLDKRLTSIGADVANVMPMTHFPMTPTVERRPRRKSLNPVSWWRY